MSKPCALPWLACARLLAAVGIIYVQPGCVNLDKPAPVAQCAKTVLGCTDKIQADAGWATSDANHDSSGGTRDAGGGHRDSRVQGWPDVPAPWDSWRWNPDVIVFPARDAWSAAEASAKHDSASMPDAGCFWPEESDARDDSASDAFPAMRDASGEVSDGGVHETGAQPGPESAPELAPERGIEPSPEPRPEASPEPPVEPAPEPRPDAAAADAVTDSLACPSLAILSGGQSGNFNTSGIFCFATCDDITTDWGCSNFDGRQVKVNGVLVTCDSNGQGQMPLPAKVNGAYYLFQVSAGTYNYASIHWSGVWHATCPMPDGGFVP